MHQKPIMCLFKNSSFGCLPGSQLFSGEIWKSVAWTRAPGDPFLQVFHEFQLRKGYKRHQGQQGGSCSSIVVLKQYLWSTFTKAIPWFSQGYLHLSLLNTYLESCFFLMVLCICSFGKIMASNPISLFSPCIIYIQLPLHKKHCVLHKVLLKRPSYTASSWRFQSFH